MLAVLALALALPTARRRYHDARKHRHAHTFLQLCTDGSTTESQACVEKVDNKWPKPAVLAPLSCMGAGLGLGLQQRDRPQRASRRDAAGP